jgi:hypothetical protein
MYTARSWNQHDILEQLSISLLSLETVHNLSSYHKRRILAHFLPGFKDLQSFWGFSHSSLNMLCFMRVPRDVFEQGLLISLSQ